MRLTETYGPPVPDPDKDRRLTRTEDSNSTSLVNYLTEWLDIEMATAEYNNGELFADEDAYGLLQTFDVTWKILAVHNQYLKLDVPDKRRLCDRLVHCLHKIDWYDQRQQEIGLSILMTIGRTKLFKLFLGLKIFHEPGNRDTLQEAIQRVLIDGLLKLLARAAQLKRDGRSTEASEASKKYFRVKEFLLRRLRTRLGNSTEDGYYDQCTAALEDTYGHSQIWLDDAKSQIDCAIEESTLSRLEEDITDTFTTDAAATTGSNSSVLRRRTKN